MSNSVSENKEKQDACGEGLHQCLLHLRDEARELGFNSTSYLLSVAAIAILDESQMRTNGGSDDET